MTELEKNTIDEILAASKVIAIVGLSSRGWRPSYQIAEYLQSAGYRIIPINPKETEVLGAKAFASLEDVPEPIDVVNVFRRSVSVPPVVESAIRVGAKAVWMQEGVIHEEAARRARAAGLRVVMDRCILKEHSRWRAEQKQAASAS
ncbi:MAG: CoA-binding protein [Acidobacteria bacterium RIFCSPLOWO2_12_FULL_60_22]|nr:MAG: CoA-binding protein [Acidobacteria bacterium RIFCSPLOWO2_12_FULL_60_22]